MTTNNDAARKLWPVPDLDQSPSPRVSGALAGFIVCAFAGAIFGYAAGLLTGFIAWHH